MKKVYVVDAPAVQTISPDGIGVVPTQSVGAAVETMTEQGRGMDELAPPVNHIPNPAVVNKSSVIQEKDGAWQAGAGGGDDPASSDVVGQAVVGSAIVGSSGGELPEYSDDDLGKVLTVGGSAEAPALVWAPSDGGLPSYTSSDVGKTLQVAPGEDAPELAWEDPVAYDNITVLDVILPETSIDSGSKGEYDQYYYVYDIPLSTDPVVGGTYRVTYDGEEYILDDWSNTYYESVPYIGYPIYKTVNPNAEVSDDRYKTPFDLALYPDSNNGRHANLTTREGGSHTYKIELIQEEVKPVPSRLISLPAFTLLFDSTPTRTWTSSDTPTLSYSLYEEINGKTFNDLIQAMSDGWNVVIRWMDQGFPIYGYIMAIPYSYGTPDMSLFFSYYLGNYVDAVVSGDSLSIRNWGWYTFPKMEQSASIHSDDPGIADYKGVPNELRPLALVVGQYSS